MQNKLPFTASKVDGSSLTFYSVEEFLDFYRATKNVGTYWLETNSYNWRTNRVGVMRAGVEFGYVTKGVANDWIVRDAWGQVIRFGELKDSRPRVIQQIKGRYGQYQRIKDLVLDKGKYAGAIPGTGKRRRGRCRCNLCAGSHTTKGGRKAHLRDQARAEYDMKEY